MKCVVVIAAALSAGQAMAQDAASVDQTPALPAWVSSPPAAQNGFAYFVGEGCAGEKDEALERAWYSALIRFGRVTFPELTTVQSTMKETLRTIESKTISESELRYIAWSGVGEVQERGSPHITHHAGEYCAYRLLRWGTTQIEVARKKAAKRVAQAKPETPEEVKKRAGKIERLQQMTEESKKDNDDLLVILREIPCRMKMSEVVSLIGEPSTRQVAPDGSRCVGAYFYGDYSITAESAECPSRATYSTTDYYNGSPRIDTYLRAVGLFNQAGTEVIKDYCPDAQGSPIGRSDRRTNTGNLAWVAALVGPKPIGKNGRQIDAPIVAEKSGRLFIFGISVSDWDRAWRRCTGKLDAMTCNRLMNRAECEDKEARRNLDPQQRRVQCR